MIAPMMKEATSRGYRIRLHLSVARAAETVWATGGEREIRARQISLVEGAISEGPSMSVQVLGRFARNSGFEMMCIIICKTTTNRDV